MLPTLHALEVAKGSSWAFDPVAHRFHYGFVVLLVTAAIAMVNIHTTFFWNTLQPAGCQDPLMSVDWEAVLASTAPPTTDTPSGAHTVPSGPCTAKGFCIVSCSSLSQSMCAVWTHLCCRIQISLCKLSQSCDSILPATAMLVLRVMIRSCDAAESVMPKVWGLSSTGRGPVSSIGLPATLGSSSRAPGWASLYTQVWHLYVQQHPALFHFVKVLCLNNV